MTPSDLVLRMTMAAGIAALSLDRFNVKLMQTDTKQRHTALKGSSTEGMVGALEGKFQTPQTTEYCRHLRLLPEPTGCDFSPKREFFLEFFGA